MAFRPFGCSHGIYTTLVVFQVATSIRQSLSVCSSVVVWVVRMRACTCSFRLLVPLLVPPFFISLPSVGLTGTVPMICSRWMMYRRSRAGSLFAEIFFTCVFVLVVLGATAKTNGATNNFAGLASVCHWFWLPVCIRYTLQVTHHPAGWQWPLAHRSIGSVRRWCFGRW